jgi:uncharacterized protein (TIGR02145 family)
MKRILIYAILFTLGVSCDKEELESPATLLNSNLTYGTLEDIDGNTYATIQIGEQIWMANNLRTTRFSNGDTIPKIVESWKWQNDTIGAWTYYMNDSLLNSKHGKLYNWYAVNNPNNICPKGWHVPTIEEWSNLLLYLGGMGNAGKKMKSEINGAWATEYDGQKSNAEVNNESGFSSVASGSRNIDAQFSLMTYRASYWSSTKANTWYPAAYSCELFWNDDAVSLSPEDKEDGLCIRCIMD